MAHAESGAHSGGPPSLIGSCWSGGFGIAARRPETCNGPGSCCCPPGVDRPEIADRVGCTEPTVVLWRQRFAEEGLAGLDDWPRKSSPMRSVTKS